MRYTSLTGTTRTGAVWSPGPLANSLWVLDDATGEPVVVKVWPGYAKHGKAVEFGSASVAGAVQAEVDAGVAKRCDKPWRTLKDVHVDFRPHVLAMHYRHAAKLPEKVWRAAVGDQCEQLELTAA